MRRRVRSVFMTMSLWPVVALANPFSALSPLPVGEIPAAGKIIVTLQDGDYVLPRFSPDSRHLAFSRVLTQAAAEHTEIQALDLRTLKVNTLLDAKSSREFALHKGFVSDFVWQDATRLKAGISDGDVNGVNLVFDVPAGRLIEKKPFSLTEERPDAEGALASQLVPVFPSIPPPVLTNALANGFKAGDRRYIVQKNYWKQDNHVWLLDADRRQAVKLVELPETWLYSLRGGFASGNAIVMLVAYGSEAWLVRHAGRQLELLHRFTVKSYQQTALRVELVRGDQVLFQVSTGPDYERRENFLFVYDKSGLKKIVERAPVYDYDVDPAGTLVSASQWSGKQRRLVVRELKEFR